jgi:hypothetical protein
MQAVWCSCTVEVARAVFEFTRSELMDVLELAKLGESTSALRQNSEIAAQEQNINAAVRYHLPWIERSAFAVHLIYLGYLEGMVKRIASHMREPDPLKMRSAIYIVSSVMWNISDFAPAIILLRRFSVGYRHPSTLPAVYRTLKNLPTNNLQELRRNCCTYITLEYMPCLDSMGIEHWTKLSGGWVTKGSPGHMPWRFASNVVSMEMYWRLAPAVEGLSPAMRETHMQLQYLAMCDRFGEAIIEATYGDSRPPWTEERLRTYEVAWH